MTPSLPPTRPSAYGPRFKVRLSSGRLLGPLDLDRVRRLILAGHIQGTEIARAYPEGGWTNINLLPEVAQLLIAHADGLLREDSPLPVATAPDPVDVAAPTVALTEQSGALPGGWGEPQALTPLDDSPPPPPLKPGATRPSPRGSARQEPDSPAQEERTISGLQRPPRPLPERASPRPTAVDAAHLAPLPIAPPDEPEEPDFGFDLAREPTLALTIPVGAPPPSTRSRLRDLARATLVAIAFGMAVHELFLAAPETPPRPLRTQALRPRLPGTLEKGARNPERSAKLYAQAMQSYVLDTVPGYARAAELLLDAATQDRENVRALAMLASTYLNLIDSTNKDENYFSVITQLIERSRSQGVELPETVIADSEFFLTINRPDAAQNRLVEHLKATRAPDPALYFYLALAQYARGQWVEAARTLQMIPAEQAFGARVFYLRGLVAERLEDLDQARSQYQQAIQKNRVHARSYLRLVAVLGRQGSLRDAAPGIEFLSQNRALLTPRELAEALYWSAQRQALQGNVEQALADIERAVRLNGDERDYRLEMYSLRVRLGDTSTQYKREARMYYYLGEGERLLKEGRHHEAITQFLSARQANLESPLPLTRLGDLFLNLNDIANARTNYRLAAERAPNSIDVWSKYINVLIQSYEWEVAQKAMNRFRVLPVGQSAIDKAAGDLYAKQGRHSEALFYYRKAMTRDGIDPSVYLAYGKSLMESGDYKDAPFFFALALRYDPLSTEALLGTVRAVAQYDSKDRAIRMLQDLIARPASPKAELLTAMADLTLQKGEPERAQSLIDQARRLNPDLATPWRVQAQIYLLREASDPKALDRALQAFKSYSDRNSSDPTGYLERYRVFVKKSQFERAAEELDRVYSLFPRYPNLHYFKGALYGVMGNHNVAIEEFNQELKNNPGNVNALLALGREYVEAGRPEQALEVYNRAMVLAPRAPEPKHQAGFANYLLKNYSAAIALYQAALAFDQANPLIYKRLAMAYRDSGDATQAGQAYRKYREVEPEPDQTGQSSRTDQPNR